MIRIDHIATAFSIVGAILLSAGLPSLVPASLIIQILGGILWSAYAIKTAQKPLLIVNIAFIIVELIGVWRWMI